MERPPPTKDEMSPWWERYPLKALGIAAARHIGKPKRPSGSAERFIPVWEHMLETLVLGLFISDPRKGFARPD